jgi:competence protein ComEC
MSGRPLLAAALAFVGGVALGAWLPQEPAAWGWAAVVLLALWAALLGAGKLSAATPVGVIAFVVVGIVRLQGELAPLYAGIAGLDEGEAVVRGRVGRPAEFREGEFILHLEQARVRREGTTVRTRLPLQIIVAGGAPGYAVGDSVTARGRLRGIRGDRNLGWFPGPVTPAGKRYAARLVVASAAWIRRDGHDSGSGPGAAVLRWRAAADAFWKARPGPAGEILNSLTTGERAGIPVATQKDFLRSGLTHLLAISGMNVGFLAALVFVALRRALALWQALALRCPVQPVAAALTLPALWFFMLFSGSQIPVGRAVLSSAAGLAAVVLWRRIAPAAACALAACAIVAWDSPALFSASFQLSFAAVSAVIAVAPRVSAACRAQRVGEGIGRRFGRAGRSLFVVSLAASAVTTPLVAWHFQQASIVGPLANLAAVPYTGFVVLPAGWLALAAAAVWGPAGEFVARPALWSADGLAELAAWFAAPSWAAVRTARPPVLLTLCLLASAATLLPRPTRLWRGARFFACAAAALAGTWWGIATHRPDLFVAILDVGQGLAAAVVVPGGGTLLYDAGPRWRDYDAGERVVVPALRGLGVTRLDTLAISHAHPDHSGGVGAVRLDLRVGRTWTGAGARSLVRGDAFTLGGGVRVLVLNPPAAAAVAPAADTAAANANDGSLALLVALGDTGVVFTGDAGPAMAGGLAAAAAGLPAHVVLQAPHHGGSPEACRILAAALRPEASVISVGRNTYGHPRPEAVAALAARGRVLRTDRDGAVFIRGDGSRFEVRTWRELATGRTWPERVRWLASGW